MRHAADEGELDPRTSTQLAPCRDPSLLRRAVVGAGVLAVFVLAVLTANSVHPAETWQLKGGGRGTSPTRPTSFRVSLLFCLLVCNCAVHSCSLDPLSFCLAEALSAVLPAARYIYCEKEHCCNYLLMLHHVDPGACTTTSRCHKSIRYLVQQYSRPARVSLEGACLLLIELTHYVIRRVRGKRGVLGVACRRYRDIPTDVSILETKKACFVVSFRIFKTKYLVFCQACGGTTLPSATRSPAAAARCALLMCTAVLWTSLTPTSTEQCALSNTIKVWYSRK